MYRAPGQDSGGGGLNRPDGQVATATRRATTMTCFIAWAVLSAIQLGWVPMVSRSWAFNLWQYFPTLVQLLLLLVSFAFCFDRTRSALLEGLDHLQPGLRRWGSGLRLVAWLALVPIVLWGLRERQLLGDSDIIVFALGSGWHFVFPDVGVTWIMGLANGVGAEFGLAPRQSLQAWACVAAPLFVYALIRTVRYLTPGRSTPLVVLLVVSGGTLRTFAGHIEVYSTFLIGATLYLWIGLARLHGAASPLASRLALGIAIWMHASALFLLPGLIVLEFLDRQSGIRPWRQVVIAVAQAAVPGLLFLVWLCVSGRIDDLERAWNIALEMLGKSQDPYALQWWARVPGSAPGIGTDYVFLDRGHRKYLANAAFLLAPASIPLLLGRAILRPRHLVRTPIGGFLAASLLPLLFYTCLVRPVWGPFDWDLFSLTARFATMLAASLLAQALDPASFRWVLFAAVGFQLLFVGLPFLAIGVYTPIAAGPFLQNQFDFHMRWTTGLPVESLAPWL